MFAFFLGFHLCNIWILSVCLTSLKEVFRVVHLLSIEVSHSQQSGLAYVNICWSVAEHKTAGEEVIVRWHQSFWPCHVRHFGTEPAVPLLCWHEHSNVGFLEQPSRLGPSGLKPPKLRFQRPTYLSCPDKLLQFTLRQRGTARTRLVPYSWLQGVSSFSAILKGEPQLRKRHLSPFSWQLGCPLPFWLNGWCVSSIISKKKEYAVRCFKKKTRKK